MYFNQNVLIYLFIGFKYDVQILKINAMILDIDLLVSVYDIPMETRIIDSRY